MHGTRACTQEAKTVISPSNGCNIAMQYDLVVQGTFFSHLESDDCKSNPIVRIKFIVSRLPINNIVLAYL
eukprot:jgi/Botrbrau1/10937/Bobra.0025s0110.1